MWRLVSVLEAYRKKASSGVRANVSGTCQQFFIVYFCRYSVEGLKSECRSALELGLSLNAVEDTRALASRHRDIKLLEKCLKIRRKEEDNK